MKTKESQACRSTQQMRPVQSHWLLVPVSLVPLFSRKNNRDWAKLIPHVWIVLTIPMQMVLAQGVSWRTPRKARVLHLRGKSIPLRPWTRWVSTSRLKNILNIGNTVDDSIPLPCWQSERAILCAANTGVLHRTKVNRKNRKSWKVVERSKWLYYSTYDYVDARTENFALLVKKNV